MRLVQVIDTFLLGGAQTLLVTLARELRRREVGLTVICLRADPDAELHARLCALGAAVFFEPAPGLFDPRRLRRLSARLRGADLVATHLTYANIVGGVGAHLAGVPLVATLHNQVPDPGLPSAARARIETVVLRRTASQVIAVGPQVARAVSRSFPAEKLQMVPNAVDLPAPLPAAEREALRFELTGDPSRPLLITAGRLSPQKGLLDLLEAFARVRECSPAAALAIAGSGGMETEIRAGIERLGLSESVLLLGRREDILRLLAAADVYVSAAHWEGLPVAVLEAMAAGLPVVATCVGDLPSVLVGEAGRLVPAHQPAALAQAVCALLADPAARHACGLAARAQVERHHNATTWGARMMAIYARAVGPA